MIRSCVALWFLIAASAVFDGAARAQQNAAREADSVRGSTSSAPDAVESEDASKVAIEGVRLGFNGVYKVGRWTPLAVTLRSNGKEPIKGELTVEVVDGDGAATLIREPGVSIAPRTSIVVRMLVKPGRPRAPVKVRFESPAGAVERTFAENDIQPALLATQELFLEIGRPIGLDRLRQYSSGASLDLPAATTEKDPDTLPAIWLGYDAVDVVSVTTSDPQMLAAWDARRVDALERWVRLGGKLILCVGRNGATFSTKQEIPDSTTSPLSRFLPGRVVRVVERVPREWESLFSASEPMPGQIQTAQLEGVQGQIELSDKLSDSIIPLVVRTPYGFGEVLFVAADLDQPPLADWSAQTKLLLRLLDRAEIAAGSPAARDSSVQGIRLGYTDLNGQLRAALGRFAGAPVVPFWPVFLLALGYAAALFPLEFALARWLRPRFEAAWVLLPLVLGGGAIGVWFLATEWKGRETLVNKIEVIDVDLTSGAVRGHVWLGVYSPREDAYDLALSPSGQGPATINAQQLSWLGLPGTGLGGMNSQVGTLAQFEHGYEFEPSGSLAGVPFAAWSSKSFEAAWQSSGTASPVQLGERGSDAQPRGVFKNATRITLRDCKLLYNRRSYDVGTLAPGQSVDFGLKRSLLTIQSYLTGRRPVGDKEQATPFEPDGSDLQRIVRAILFHDAAGGRQYTSLSNRVYDRLDLSGQLRLDRAVLLAIGPPATRVSIKGNHSEAPKTENELAYYRFVISVNRGGTSDEEPPTIELRLD
jgi:hypothetical protein